MASLFPSSISSAPPRRGLLGFGGPQPPAGLLGKYYSPEEERRRKISGALTQAGIQLLTNGRGSFGEVLGQGLAGAVQGANQAGQDYRQDAFGYQQLEQQQADRQRQIENEQFTRGRLNRQDAWTNTEHQQTLEDRAEAEKLKTNQRNSIMEWANEKETQKPGFLSWVENFPEEAAKMYAAEMMPPEPMKPTTDIQDYNYGVGNPGFRDYEMNKTKAGASQTNINMKGLSAEEEAAGKPRGERMDKLESGESIKGFQQIQLAATLLKDVDTNALAGMKGTAGNILTALGVPVEGLSYIGIDPNIVTTGPEIQSLVTRENFTQ